MIQAPEHFKSAPGLIIFRNKRGGEPPLVGEPPLAYRVVSEQRLCCCDRVCYIIT